MLASLPWYDLREVRPANDALWSLVATRLRAAGLERVPERLERRVGYLEQWASGRLLLSQACGYDVRLSSAHHLQLVATPRYRAPGCDGTRYASRVVVRADSPHRELRDLRGARCVINTATSHSGMNILRALVAPLHSSGRFFSSVRVTGSHEKSLRALFRGDADVAAVDCVTAALLERHRPGALAFTRALCVTPTVSAPPFVTDVATPPDVVQLLRDALAAALADPAAEPLREHLLLDGVDALTIDAYEEIAELERVAEEHGLRDFAPLR